MTSHLIYMIKIMILSKKNDKKSLNMIKKINFKNDDSKKNISKNR